MNPHATYVRRFFLGLSTLILACAVRATNLTEIVEAPSPRVWPENPTVFIIPVNQEIDKPQLFLIRRGIKRAREAKADAIVLRMDTLGGWVDVMRQIVNLIIDLDIPTYTLVERDAFSAGAIIAVATDHIYMKPQTVIGDAMPVIMGPQGYQEQGEAEREKIESGMDAIVRSIAQAKNRDELLIRCMVRRELVYEFNGEVLCREGEILTLTNLEAEKRHADGRPLLSMGTVEDLDAMLAAIGLSHANRLEEIPTWADQLAVWITRASPILLMLAMLLFYMEINSPGFGWMGGAALVCFLIVMFGHQVAGLAGMEDMVLILLGMILILLEILVIPGFGLAGITGIVLLVWGLLQAMIERYPGNPGQFPGFDRFGNVGPAVTNVGLAILGSLILMTVLIRFLQNSKHMNRHAILNTALSQSEGFVPAGPEAHPLIGAFGTTLTDLRPSGTAEIAGREFSVVSDGAFLEAGARIHVVDAHGNRIVVASASSPENPPA